MSVFLQMAPGRREIIGSCSIGGFCISEFEMQKSLMLRFPIKKSHSGRNEGSRFNILSLGGE
jgi:hypothetical protein